jgi:hypothetical protein
MARKPHPDDARKAAQIEQAVSYTVHFRKSPSEKHKVSCTTLEAARAAEVRLNQMHGGSGRRAIIYAIAADGTAHPMGASYVAPEKDASVGK